MATHGKKKTSRKSGKPRKPTASSADEGKLSFVVDTDAYAGNFERQLLAYVTGRLSEYPVLDCEALAARYLAETGVNEIDAPDDPLADLIAWRMCEHDDMGYLDRVKIAPTPGWSNDGMGGHTRLKAGERAVYPAYQSVAIFLATRPTAKQLALLKARALAFATVDREYGQKIVVTGCRLVRERTVVESEPV